MKHKVYLPYSELASLPIPNRPFCEISFDFVTGLPESKIIAGKIADTILVVIDRYTKYAIYIPTTTRVTSDSLVTLLFQNIFERFGIPDEIVSDRGSLFTSKFWATFCHHIAYKRRLSIAYHPQTDGQTERQNQTMEQYLRTYCGAEQND